MKNNMILSITAVLLAVSCTRTDEYDFSSLDRALRKQEHYDMVFESMIDSLTACYRREESDSLKWEMAYELETKLVYHRLDSCWQYIDAMRRLCRNDTRQRQLSEISYIFYLTKADSLKAALNRFVRIDTTGLSSEGLSIYCDAGYHIYRDITPQMPEYEEKKQELLDYWMKYDRRNPKCVYYYNNSVREAGGSQEAIAMLLECPLETVNDTAKVYDYIGREYYHMGDIPQAIRYLAIASECDMRQAAKTYNSLYMLARILFQEGDITRADRYMRVTRQDALTSNYRTRYEKVFQLELDVMNAMLDQQDKRKTAYLIVALMAIQMLALAIVLLVLLNRYSRRLSTSRRSLYEMSRIKDRFLAVYMEKCVDYLNKVDKYRSSLRQAVKHEGPDAAIAILKRPSFADGEFKELLADFDTAFLGIFPDFVEKVNEHMKPEHQLTMPSEGQLSTELRILALIRMGITNRQKIAKVLNMSANTVYSYHCNLHKHSLHPDSSFDKVIANL